MRDGIRVNAVAPALVDTPIAQSYRAVTEAGYQNLVNQQPLGIGHPDDVAAAIAFLMAGTSKWITGTVLNVDGGFLA
ncbi:MAG: SDR family oxidoreductase [Asticcacaulis sp.]